MIPVCINSAKRLSWPLCIQCSRSIMNFIFSLFFSHLNLIILFIFSRFVACQISPYDLIIIFIYHCCVRIRFELLLLSIFYAISLPPITKISDKFKNNCELQTHFIKRPYLAKMQMMMMMMNPFMKISIKSTSINMD